MLGTVGIFGWVSWVMIGIALGVMSGRPMASGKMIWYNIAVSLTGSVAGGVSSVLAVGYGTPQLFIISELGALFVAGGILWLAVVAYEKFISK